MHIRSQRITRALQAYDRELFAEPVLVKKRRPDYNEEIHDSPWIYLEQVQVKRKVVRDELFWLTNDAYVIATKPCGDYLFSLTEDWTQKANPVDWGVEPILAKIREMDRWNRGGEDLFEEIEKNNQRVEAIEERAEKAAIEDQLRQMHEGFRKSTDDINTALLKDPRTKKLTKRSY